MSIKLHVLLAKTEHLASPFKAMLRDFKEFFTNKQSSFRGVRKTYEPFPDTADEPSMRGNVIVVTTVKEKLEWLEENSRDYIDNLFSVEATNASGTACAELKVDNISFGTLSSLELLRLKSLLEMENFEQMYANIPVRSDSEIWDIAESDPFYDGRDIWRKPLIGAVRKTTLKESYILPDPNIKELKDTSKYNPVVSSKDTIKELGTYTVQEFSGEYSHLQRASILRRRSKLLNAVIEALKVSNDCEVINSQMTSKKLFSYLHEGK
jgi:hypothetical protein